MAEALRHRRGGDVGDPAVAGGAGCVDCVVDAHDLIGVRGGLHAVPPGQSLPDDADLPALGVVRVCQPPALGEIQRSRRLLGLRQGAHVLNGDDAESVHIAVLERHRRRHVRPLRRGEVDLLLRLHRDVPGAVLRQGCEAEFRLIDPHLVFAPAQEIALSDLHFRKGLRQVFVLVISMPKQVIDIVLHTGLRTQGDVLRITGGHGIHGEIEFVVSRGELHLVGQRPIKEHMAKFHRRLAGAVCIRIVDVLHDSRRVLRAVCQFYVAALRKIRSGALQVCGGTLLQGLQLSDGAVPAPQPFRLLFDEQIFRCPPHKGEGDKSRHQREKQRPHWLTPRGAQKNVSLH